MKTNKNDNKIKMNLKWKFFENSLFFFSLSVYSGPILLKLNTNSYE